MYTIDASVHVNAIHSAETGSSISQAFLERVNQRELPLFCPTLLFAEVAAAVARSWDNTSQGIAVSNALRQWPHQTLVALDGVLISRAIHLAATARLRGADAVYAAVAEQFGTTLITLDQQQLARLSSIVRVLRPADALAALAT